MEIATLLKCLCAAIIPVTSLIIMHLTQYFQKLHVNPNKVGYINSFSTGIILSMTIVRILPYSQKQVDSSLNHKQKLVFITNSSLHPKHINQFPWAFFSALMTYSFFLLLDNILLPQASRQNKKIHKKMVQHYNKNKAFKIQQGLIYDAEFHLKMSEEEQKLEATNESPSKLLEKTKKPFLSTFISIFAMSVQVFVAGLTIGILTDPHHLIILMIATLIHRCASATVIGCLIQQDGGSERRKIILMLFYAASTTIGIFVGWLLPVDGLSLGILLGITAGCLLYICISDIVVKEFTVKESNWKKFIFFFLGLAIENFLWFIELYENNKDISGI